MASQHYRVGSAARSAGVGVQTLHYYERRGLVRPSDRSESGYREYGEPEVRRVRAIKQAQSLGFTLREIRELIEVAESGRSAQQAARLAQGKIEEIDAKIHALRRMRRSLARTLETCRCGGDVSRCDVLEGLGEPRPASTRASRPAQSRRRTP